MKKILLLALLFISQMSCLKAFDIQARAAYFLPEDSRMRDVYSKKGFAEYELEASTPLASLYECAPCNWDAFTNLSFYQKRGRSSCFNDRSRVTNWTLNFGVKRYFDTCWCFRPYLGVGAGAVHARFHDESDYVSRHTNKWGVAILAKSGIRYDVTCNLFLDFFADYSYSWFNFHHRKSCVAVRNVNTGGLKLGLGLGYQF
jgi:opacity protein-like surface antigen